MHTPSEDVALTILCDAKLIPPHVGLTPQAAGDYIVRLAADIIRERQDARAVALFGIQAPASRP